MLIKYFFVLMFPIAMIICVNLFSKDYIKGIKNIPIAGVLLNILGISGIVFAFLYKNWNTSNLIIFELVYGLPSVAATWGYAYYLDKQNKKIVQLNKEKYCKQTIDVKKMRGV